MAVTIRYWAGARRAAGVAEERFDAVSLPQVKAALSARPELRRIAEVASYLVDGAQVSPAAALPDGAVVDVLPPFAGGRS